MTEESQQQEAIELSEQPEVVEAVAATEGEAAEAEATEGGASEVEAAEVEPAEGGASEAEATEARLQRPPKSPSIQI